MERIAAINGHITIYWSMIVLALAGVSAVCLFLALYLRTWKRFVAAFLGIPLAIGLSMVLSRLTYWYFRPDSYESFAEILQWHQPGGVALMGLFAGCFLVAVLLRLVRLEKNLPYLLDCISVALCFGIALGRLASFFNTSDRGMTVSDSYGLPWAIPGISPVSGIPECRLATFLMQAMVAGCICLVLLLFFLTGKRHPGDTTLLFLLFYGASQVVLDSTRYDSLYLRSNGFISAVQVLGAAGIVVAVVAFEVRLVRAGGWKLWHPVLWFVQAGCFALAGYMEYYVQRHENAAVLAYSVMGGALAALMLLTLVTRCMAQREEKKHEAWLAQLAEVRGGA